MEKDLCGKLNDDWWQTANEATKWKPKYECMVEIFYILTGSENLNVEIKCDIINHKKSNDLIKILTNWLINENHVFTRIAILRLMPKLIHSFSKKVLSKYQNQLFQTLLTKQWNEKKKSLLNLVTPTILELWKKCDVKLNSDQIKPFLIAALKHRGKEVRFSAADFITKCAMYEDKKKQVITLCQDREFGELLSKLAINDKENSVRLAACKALYFLYRIGSLKKHVQFDNLMDNKRTRKNMERAIREFANTKFNINSFVVNIWDKKQTSRILTNSSKLQRELLVYGYGRICGLASIPNDILRLCLFMVGFADFHWIPMYHYRSHDTLSPTYYFNNFQFHFVLRDSYGYKTSLYVKFNELELDKENEKWYTMKVMILFFTFYWTEKKMQFRYIFNINNWGKEYYINSFDKISSLEFYGDLKIIHLQINDTLQNKLKIYNENIKLFRRYKFEWNLSNIKKAASYKKDSNIYYYSPIFCDIWYLIFGDGLQLNLLSLPHNISSIYIKWIYKLKFDDEIKEVISSFATMSLESVSSRDSNQNNKSKIEFKNKKYENIDFKLLSFDIEIEILGILDRNYFSKISNVIFADNLVLYGIIDDEYKEMNNNDFDFNGISLQREIENIAIQRSGYNNNCIHAINDIVKSLRNEYDEKILKLQNQVNELKKVTNNKMEDELNKCNKNKQDGKQINEWLTETVKLPQYFKILIENGFDSLEMIKEINNKQDLEYIGITLKGHQIKIMNEINKL